MDNTLTNGKEDGLEFWDLQKTAIQTNSKYAQMLGIPVSKAITCLKPSGTCSQLVDSASGIHARHNEYYIRTVRDNKDPLTEFMKAQEYHMKSAYPNQITPQYFRSLLHHPLDQ